MVFKRGVSHAVTVELREKPLGPETIVRVDDVIPSLPFLRRKSGYSVTTGPTYLTASRFGEVSARSSINRNRHKARGRILSLSDSDGDLAAISFHIHGEEGVPVIIRTIALRTDSQEMADLSLAAAGWLLAYLAEVSRKAKLPVAVGADEGKQSNPDVLYALGFRKGQRPSRFSCAGDYLVFEPPRWFQEG